jgi:hypothetical protein
LIVAEAAAVGEPEVEVVVAGLDEDEIAVAGEEEEGEPVPGTVATGVVVLAELQPVTMEMADSRMAKNIQTFFMD